MMFYGIDENFDPNLFEELDNLDDFDPDKFPMDEDSGPKVTKIRGWLCDYSPPTYTDSLYERDGYIVCSFDITLDRREWLIQDPISKRQRSPRLFEFLVLLLGKSRYESYASFIDRSKGIFQIHQPNKVAELWQAVKSRQSHQKMTYDKFARAIRWYYKSNIMQKTNTRYTFQFSSQSLRTYFVDENNNSKTDFSP
jgi:hypothetical protein